MLDVCYIYQCSKSTREDEHGMRHNINKEGNSYRVTSAETVRHSETWRPSSASRRRASDVKVYDRSGKLIRTIKSSKPRTKRSTVVTAQRRAEIIAEAKARVNVNNRRDHGAIQSSTLPALMVD